MIPQRNPLCSEMEQSKHDLTPIHCSVDRASDVARTWAEPGRSNEDTASSSPESVSLNGDGKRSGKNRRRRKRASARPESCPPAEEQEGGKGRGGEELGPAPDSALLGLRSEYASVWFDRSAYEQAESFYQCWLAHSTDRRAQPSESPQPPETLPTPEAPVSPAPLACSHADHVACHHVVQDVWVNKPSFDRAKRRSAEESLQLTVPSSLAVQSDRPAAATPATPDEGYQSQAPTPTAAPSPHQPINGLPRIPLELLGGVWLEKPLYDRAEAAFYQNLYGSNSLGAGGSRACHPNAPSTSRSNVSDHHPQSLVEEEEEDEEEEEPGAVVVPQGKAEVFHALHPIQEEEEPADVTEEDDASSAGGAAAACFFLHPDSERVWLDRWRYEAAESRFHAAVAATEVERPTSPVACSSPLRDNTMSAVDFLAQEKIWFDKPRYDDAERHYYESMNGPSHSAQAAQEMGANSILQDIARARENIQKSLAGLKTSLFPSRGSGQPPLNYQSQLSTGSGAGDQGELVSRIRGLELENQNLHKVVEDLRSALSKLENRVTVLEESPVKAGATVPAAPCTNGTTVQPKKASAPVKEEEDDDDIDLFGSDEEEEDTEAEKIKEQRLKEYAEKKAKKPALIAKSSILLDVKPWDDETDMAKLEECVRSVQADGLLWGSSKLVPVGYGIKKLQIQCVVEDDKVGTDMLEEEITKFEDHVQSVDVAAFNKI